MWRQPPRLSLEAKPSGLNRPFRVSDASNKYFALDSSARILHSEITS
jgi:hypothetical protein